MPTDSGVKITSSPSTIKRSKLKSGVEKSSSKKRKHLHQDEMQSTPSIDTSPSRKKKKRTHTEHNGTNSNPTIVEEPKKKKKKRDLIAERTRHASDQDETPPSIFGPRDTQQLVSETPSRDSEIKPTDGDKVERGRSRPGSNGIAKPLHVVGASPAKVNSSQTPDSRVGKKEQKKKKERHSLAEESTQALDLNGDTTKSMTSPPSVTFSQRAETLTELEKKARRKEKKKKRQSIVEQDGSTVGGGILSPPASPLLSSVPNQPTVSKTSQTVSQPSLSSQGPRGGEEEKSPFFVLTTSLYLPLPPIGLPKPLESLCADHLSPNLLTYFHPVEGVLLAYQNPRLMQSRSTGTTSELAMTHAEYATPYTWLTADFTIFRPERGTWLDGHVSVQNSGYIGLICYNLFNANIIEQRFPDGWTWTPGVDADVGAADETHASASPEGHWTNEKGDPVEGLIKFRVRDYEPLPSGYGRDKGFISIDGTLLDVDIEEPTERRIREGKDGRRETNRTGMLGRRLKGALKYSKPVIDEANPYGKMNDANI